MQRFLSFTKFRYPWISSIQEKWPCCTFLSHFFMMIEVETFILTNNYLKTWLWKSRETKIFTLKFSKILKNHHKEMNVEHHHSSTMLKNICNANDILKSYLCNADLVLICWASQNVVLLCSLEPRLKPGSIRKTIKTKKTKQKENKH